MSKLGLLFDIRIATSRWPFLLCFKLGHVVHLSWCDMLSGLYGHAVCTMHCRSVCLVSVPSCIITIHASTTAAIANKLTDLTSSCRYTAANKGGLWCDKEWMLSCRLWVRKRTCRGRAGGVADSPCIQAGSNDMEFGWLLMVCWIMRGIFQETAPRKTAKNTVKHRDGAVGSMIANHHGGGEGSVVVTTLSWDDLSMSALNLCPLFIIEFWLHTCWIDVHGIDGFDVSTERCQVMKV